MMFIYKNKCSLEMISGLIILIVLFTVLIIANTPLWSLYEYLTEIPIHIGVASHTITKPALLWVNEGLMAIFFMLLTLEIKSTILTEKNTNRKIILTPIITAIGGISFPILIYFIFNHGDSTAMRGWGVATTTDTAMVLAILSILGEKIPKSLRVFMLMLSIIDDIIAIFIIAIFYSESLSSIGISLAILGILVLFILNISNVKSFTPYIIIGIFIWFCVLQSGIHGTLAGVILGLTIPIYNGHKKYTPSQLESYLKLWTYYFILPLFVFMNGGISFADFKLSDLLSNVSLGIILGLFLGKSIGSFSFFYIGKQLKLAKLPYGTNIKHIISLCFLSGTGFTMSLFLGVLAFNNTIYEDLSGQAILFGSLMSLTTALILFLVFRNNKKSILENDLNTK